MFFRSERLFLRPGWPEDWSDLLSKVEDADIARNLARAPWLIGAPDERASDPTAQGRRFPHFFITLPEAATGGNDLIGCIGLFGRDDGIPVLGYWIARQRRGQGYATEAGRAVLATARTLGHRLVEADHFGDDPAAGRVIAKLGFRPTGATRQGWSLNSGQSVPAQVHAIELVGASGGDDDGSGGEKAAISRAA